jgi:hypothetical protein
MGVKLMKTLRIIYIPQVPMQPYTQEVDNLDEAAAVWKAVLGLSAFEYANNIKPDYNDAIDLETFEDGEWVTWYNDDGDDFSEVMDRA